MLRLDLTQNHPVLVTFVDLLSDFKRDCEEEIDDAFCVEVVDNLVRGKVACF